MECSWLFWKNIFSFSGIAKKQLIQRLKFLIFIICIDYLVGCSALTQSRHYHNCYSSPQWLSNSLNQCWPNTTDVMALDLTLLGALWYTAGHGDLARLLLHSDSRFPLPHSSLDRAPCTSEPEIFLGGSFYFQYLPYCWGTCLSKDKAEEPWHEVKKEQSQWQLAMETEMSRLLLHHWEGRNHRANVGGGELGTFGQVGMAEWIRVHYIVWGRGNWLECVVVVWIWLSQIVLCWTGLGNVYGSDLG